MQAHQTRAKAKLIAITASIVVIIGLVVLIDSLKNKTSTATASTDATSVSTPAASTNSSASNSSTSTASATSYKDGTYSASSSYYVPHGYESIKVTLTVANGVVTNSQIVNSESDRESAEFQQEFASSYKTYVVGKKLSDIQLSYIAGASDTTDGFNDALSQIKSDAQA